MRQVVQHVLTLVICLALVAGSIVGCADFGGTVREHPRAGIVDRVGVTDDGLLLRAKPREQPADFLAPRPVERL